MVPTVKIEEEENPLLPINSNKYHEVLTVGYNSDIYNYVLQEKAIRSYNHFFYCSVDITIVVTLGLCW